VDRNKAYCFHELVLNLPAPFDIPWGLCPQTPGPRYKLVVRTRHGAPQPLTPSAAYGDSDVISMLAGFRRYLVGKTHKCLSL